MDTGRQIFQLALQHHQAGQFAQAELLCRQILQANARHPEAYNCLGIALQEQGRLVEAMACWQEAVRLRPEMAEAFSNLGNGFELQGLRDDAIASFREALRLKPNYANAHGNLGNVFKAQGNLADALAHYQQALRFNPNHAGAHNNLGGALLEMGRFDEAIAARRQAIRLQPNYADAHHNLGLNLLRLGNFTEGWAEYEWRWRSKEFLEKSYAGPSLPQPFWDGSPLQGRTILLHAEQGLGDTIQFVRYATLLKQRGAGKVLLGCLPPLLRLMSRCRDIDQVIYGTPSVDFDVQASLLSLPPLLGTNSVERIPYDIPYLDGEPELVEYWKERLASRERKRPEESAISQVAYAPGSPFFPSSLRVGIAWQGNPSHKGDRWRSVRLEQFALLAKLAGVGLVSLQKGPGSEQLEKMPDLAGSFAPELNDLIDTAALIRCLDLVITVDTSVAHLAGALGVPVWVALPMVPDWRWLLHREDSPWYPSMRLFRQTERGQWDDVFERIKIELANELKRRRSGIAVNPVRQILERAMRHQEAGQFAQAEHLYRQILQADPRHAEAHNCLGVTLQAQGRLDKAVACWQEAVRLKPDLAQAFNNLGNGFYQQGRQADAIASYRQALRLLPNYANAHNNLANVLKAQGNLPEAATHYQHAVRLRPDLADAHNNLGNVLKEQGNLDEALICYRRALAVRPDFAEAHSNIGNVLTDQRQLPEAVVSFREALRLKPDYAEARCNLGAALQDLGSLDEAVASYQQALRLKPDYADAHSNLGNALMEQGKPAEAADSYRRALKIQPDFLMAHMNLGMLLLRTGNFEQGWPEYQWRCRRRHYHRPNLTQPFWDGAAFQGQTILLRAEQGLGDLIQFIRYAPLLKQRGAGKVLAECPAELLRLLSRCPGVDQAFSESPLPAYDLQAFLLSLPRLLSTTSVERIPANVPYLECGPELVERWEARLASLHGHRSSLRVGIVWQGNPVHKGDRWRSVRLEQFAPLAKHAGISLVSLQKGPGSEQLEKMPGLAFNLGPELADFADTAAVIRCLDLVITVDTAVAHLAGALGAPVWVVLPNVSDWRWLLHRPDSPWYPTMRLFRQKRFRDWDEVFDRVESEAKNFAVGEHSVMGCAGKMLAYGEADIV